MATELIASSLIRDIPDFPQPGILFKDITPVLAHPAAFQEIIDKFAEIAKQYKPDVVVGIESRGFVFGAPLALALGLGFIPVRKKGKLPYITLYEEYALEYGSNVVEIHNDAIAPGSVPSLSMTSWPLAALAGPQRSLSSGSARKSWRSRL